MRLLLIATSIVLTCMVPAAAENWPTWRGPSGTNVSHEAGAPLTWSREENVRWKVALPEPGNSTPIVWGDRLFLAQPLAKENRRTLMCFDRRDGKLLWQEGTTYSSPEPTHPTNPFCSASPATDGRRVVAWFGSAGVFCYDLQGKELWHRDLGVQEHEWGYASSPVIHGELCFLNFGPGKREFVIALDMKTGETVWQFDVPPPPPTPAVDEKAKTAKQRDEELRGSWSTPLVIDAAGRPELIITLPERVVAFDPRSGARLWNCEGLGSLVYASPMWGDGVLVALGGYHRACLAVKPGGTADVTSTHRIWHMPTSKLRLGTGVVHKGHYYVNDMESIVQCVDLMTNQIVWQQRLAGTSGDNATWASLVLTADERLYMPNQSGDTFVFRAGPEFELLATNSLGEKTNSSTVICDGQVFIRTHEHLWCIEQSKP
jgi:outer membrane protein assembly factor BamB